MTITIIPPSLVAGVVMSSFHAEGTCTKPRTMTDISPPEASPTARMIFQALNQSSTEFKIAFIDNCTDAAVTSCYDNTINTIFIRADKQYLLTEYSPRVEMLPIVLLYHELGHAKQYLDGAGERLVKEDSSATYTGGNQMSWKGGEKVAVPKRGKVSQFNMHGYSMNLETNNMRLHEWPISRELGVPLRSKYTDICEA